nr:epithelial-stromal interaction protein 1 isoform X2 [Vicugna pacos]
MYTRSRVLGSGSGVPAASRPARDPSVRSRELGPPEGPRPGLEATPESPSLESPERTAPRFTGAYTVIAPNEKRRNEMQRIAEKELEDLERWKEKHRAQPINLEPRRLGGSQSEAEVRQRQQLQLMQSKYQQKLNREESIRIKKEAEEAEIQKMKAIQREKSNKLEEKKRLQEFLRREAFREHQQYKTAEFLRRLDTELPSRSTCQVAPCKLPVLPRDHSWSELLEFKRQQQEEGRTKTHQAEHRRVNHAFLDQRQGGGQAGGLQGFGGRWNMNSRNSWNM